MSRFKVARRRRDKGDTRLLDLKRRQFCTDFKLDTTSNVFGGPVCGKSVFAKSVVGSGRRKNAILFCLLFTRKTKLNSCTIRGFCSEGRYVAETSSPDLDAVHVCAVRKSPSWQVKSDSALNISQVIGVSKHFYRTKV